MTEGVVTWFDGSRGFGFIEAAGRSAVFVHATAIVDPFTHELERGQRVTFELIEEMGPRAANVCLAHEPSDVRIVGQLGSYCQRGSGPAVPDTRTGPGMALPVAFHVCGCFHAFA